MEGILVCKSVKENPTAPPGLELRRTRCSECSEDLWITTKNIGLPLKIVCHKCGVRLAGDALLEGTHNSVAVMPAAVLREARDNLNAENN